MAIMKKIVLLGATGSIGENTLSVVDAHRDALSIVGIAAKSRWEKLAKIAKKYGVKHVGIFDENAAKIAKESGAFATGTHFYVGEQGLIELAALAGRDIVITAVVGTLGLKPTLAAIDAGTNVAVSG